MSRDTSHEARGTIKSFTDLNSWRESRAMVIARDVGYLDVQVFNSIANQPIECHKILTGLINATKGRDS